MPDFYYRHGKKWSNDVDPLDAEFWFIRKGEEWLQSQGRSLFFHYKEVHKMLWPKHYQHRWFDLALQSFCENEITVLMGCSDSAKTYGMSCFALMDYWIYPKETLWMVSSTEYRGCELRIWGEIKNLFNQAKERYSWLDGHPLESMHSITTENIDDDKEFARSLKTGLILVPCKRGNQYVGLSAFQGAKAPRLRHAGDEVAAMNEGFLNAYANWYGKRNFKGLMSGNPTDPEDQLCRAGEPLEGWDHFVDTEKTQTWRSKFFNANVIAFDGRDSPNNDFDQAKGPKFHFLVSKKKLEAVAKSFGSDSWQWHSQCVGKPNKSVLKFRVLTKQKCEEGRALEDVIWFGDKTTIVYGLDPNYGGQDRCVGGAVEFGKDVEGNQVVAFHSQEVIPVKPVIRPLDLEPEDQIAAYIKNRCDQLGIPGTQVFYDSVGKGTLGFAFSKIFAIGQCPIPVDSGAKTNSRPVRQDLWVDEEDGTRRLKRCDEHYKKFITEMYFSISEAVRSKQVRQLPQEAMRELCLRIYSIAGNNLIEIEPKSGTANRPGFIERIGHSPDMADHAVISMEGCRRLGFKIKGLGEPDPNKKYAAATWLDDLYAETQSAISSSQLQTT